MACTCEWRYEQKNGATIGYRDSLCQECIDNNAKMDLERQKQTILGQMEKLEREIYYSTLTGDIEPVSGRMWSDIKKDSWLELRQQFKSLGV